MTTEEKILELVQQVNPDNPLSYVRNIVKPIAIQKLDCYISECEDCAINCNSKKSLTKGNANAPIMIIGEAVSLEQQEGNENYVFPFEDKAGEYLMDILKAYGVDENKIFYINSVNCFPQRNGNKRSPTVNERKNCKTFLDYAIKTVEPLLIICLGAVAINCINEEIGKQRVYDIRGNMFSYRGITVMPTYHPGYFIELDGSMPEELIEEYYNQFACDIEQAISYLNEKYENVKIYK